MSNMNITKFFVGVTFLISISISIISISLLKERYQKRENVESEYKNLAARYTDVLKNYQLSCEKKIKDECDAYTNATQSLHNTLLQIIKITSVENRGSPQNICGSIAAITSGSIGFESACNDHISSMHKPFESSEHKLLYASLETSFKYCGFDTLPSEVLYLLLVMSCSLIGSSYNFRSDTKGLLNQSGADIFKYLSLGFIAYVITTGAKFVVLLGNQQFVTNVNPYSIALVGILAGMLFDRFFSLKDDLIPLASGGQNNTVQQSASGIGQSNVEENK